MHSNKYLLFCIHHIYCPTQAYFIHISYTSLSTHNIIGKNDWKTELSTGPETQGQKNCIYLNIFVDPCSLGDSFGHPDIHPLKLLYSLHFSVLPRYIVVSCETGLFCPNVLNFEHFQPSSEVPALECMFMKPCKAVLTQS